ncbi:uncharacterized protein LOC130634787 [Hydractinia symbiolongicarpus]|uniref:uncharacterized protein LOC130634787 n=1 Tax=Hydractinia symbiolongicarpus TaxID=13093 RepID=UPI00254BF381|nr:uncharacterized protein LOC130634787 [Hydractinia symbiolongicarpus]XP_057300631.1 uncharacterized protein LOC130634787 [Hydractinia symbiolongicarpus]
MWKNRQRSTCYKKKIAKKKIPSDELSCTWYIGCFVRSISRYTWMAVLKAVIVMRPSITDEKTDKNIQFYTFVKNGAYEAAKLHTAIYRKITPTNQCLSFFGAEYECMIKNFVAPFMEHIVESACNSPHCSMKQSRACFNTFPSATVKSSFVHDVQKWFLEATISICGKK